MPTAWTPDSRTVLFGSTRNGKFEIFSQDLDSVEAKLLVSGPEAVNIPRVTTDGRWLVYRVMPAGRGSDPNVRFYRVPLEGGGAPELIASSPAVASARCDLSGPCSLSVVSGTGRIVSVLDVENKKIGPEIFRTLPNSSANTPVRSRDGVWAYPAQTDKGPVVHLHTATGAFVRTVSVAGVAQLSSLDWAVDGSGWFCGSKNRELYFVDLSGKAKLVYSQASSFNPLWAIPSPDGRRLAMLTTTSDQNFWSIENF